MSTITPNLSVPAAMPFLPQEALSRLTAQQAQGSDAHGHGHVHGQDAAHGRQATGHHVAGHHAPGHHHAAGAGAAHGRGGHGPLPVGQTRGPGAAKPAAGKPAPATVGKAFEELFSSILIKHMRQAQSTGMFGHDPGDVCGGLFDHFMSQHIAQKGALGIGKLIAKHLEHRSERT